MQLGQALPSLRTYSRDKVIEYYETYVELQKPEETILRLLAPQLAPMRMLGFFTVEIGRIMEGETKSI